MYGPRNMVARDRFWLRWVAWIAAFTVAMLALDWLLLRAIDSASVRATVSKSLIFIGDVLQIAGVLVVLRGIKAVRAYLNRPIEIQVSSVMPSLTSLGEVTVIGGREPNQAERITRLEDELKRLRGDVGDLPKQLKAEWEGYTDERMKSTARWVRREIRDLAEIVVGGGRLKAHHLAAISVGLLVTGVALATVGGLFGLQA